MLAVEPQNDPGAAREALPNVFHFSFWLFPSLLWIVMVHGHDSKKLAVLFIMEMKNNKTVGYVNMAIAS